MRLVPLSFVKNRRGRCLVSALIIIGTIYLSQLIEKYNSVELAIAAYNAGHGNVDKWISQDTLKEDGTDAENIPFKETNMYVRKVMRDWKIYKSILK